MNPELYKTLYKISEFEHYKACEKKFRFGKIGNIPFYFLEFLEKKSDFLCCWLSDLPHHIQIKILQLISYRDLLNFSKSFDCYIEFLANPILWKNLTFTAFIDPLSMLCINDFHVFADFIKCSLKSLTLNLENIPDEDINTLLTKYSHNWINLKRLEIELGEKSINIDPIIINLVSLSNLVISMVNLSNDNIILITNSLYNLKSFSITTDQEVTQGLLFFLKKKKSLVGFGFLVPEASLEVLNMLFKYHSSSLRQLKIGMKNKILKHDMIEKIKNIKNLEILRLFNFEIISNFYTILDPLENICLARFENFKNQNQPIIYFTQPKLKLRKLYLSRVDLSENSFVSLLTNCPNLNLLSIEDCIIRPELFTMYSWCLNYLTFLQITEKEYDCTDYLLCIISLINNGSFVNLKTLDVLLADSISRNDEFSRKEIYRTVLLSNCDETSFGFIK